MPGRRPRLVATDLDGTLLHTDGTVTERTRDVLDALDEQGLVVVFVTGRPIRWMEPLWPHVGDLGLAVCSNGGIVYDVPSRSVARARPIPRTTGLAVADTIRAAVPDTAFAVEQSSGSFGREPGFAARGEHPRHQPEVGPLEEIFDDAVVKLLALHEEHDPEGYWGAVEQVVGGQVTATYSSFDGRALVEMSAAGVSKASTLELVCADLGIAAAEVVAFGDMPNDVTMLTWAGTSYAMANAHPLAQRAADHRAPRNDEDGVAQVLEQLFLT